MDAEFTKVLVEIAVAVVGMAATLGGSLAFTARMLQGIRRDAKIAADSASQIEELKKMDKCLQVSVERIWNVLEHGAPVRGRKGMVLTWVPAPVVEKPHVLEWDEPKTEVS